MNVYDDTKIVVLAGDYFDKNKDLKIYKFHHKNE
jgi:hypothetical protein